MIVAIDTFLWRYFVVIVAVWTTAIDLLIACAWSNVSLCYFGLSAILPFHFLPFSFSNTLSPLLALRKNPHINVLHRPSSAAITTIGSNQKYKLPKKPNRFDGFMKPTTGRYQILQDQQGAIATVRH